MGVKDIEHIYNISKIYTKMRNKEISIKEVVRLTKKAIEAKNIEAIERLSTLVFARGKEQEKKDIAYELSRKGYEDIIPIRYRKNIK